MPVPSFFRMDGWIKSSVGPSVPGAQIYVCQQPANVDTVPPTPLQDIFSDPNGLVPITQPILTDGFGHYDFYVAPGTYTLLVASSGITQQVYTDQTIGLAGGGVAGTTLTLNGSTLSSSVNIINSTNIEWADNGDGTIEADLALIDGTSNFTGSGTAIQVFIPSLASYIVMVSYTFPTVNPGILSVEYISDTRFDIHSSSPTDASNISFVVLPL